MDDQEAATWRQWINILGRIRFGKQTVNGKTVSATLIKAVAERVAQYGNPDGTQVRPGVARISVDLETGHTAVRNAITILVRVGLLRLVKPGTRRHAAVYRLIIGANLIENVELWTPSRYSLEIERTSDKYRGRPRNADSTGVSDQDETPTPQESAISPDDHPIADSSGSENPETPTPVGPQTPTPQESATNHGPRTTTDQPESQDPVADVTESRARDRPNPILRRQYPEIGATRCTEHGLAAGQRADGKPRCPICRHLKEQVA